jgi:lipid A 3-O-deacylase
MNGFDKLPVLIVILMISLEFGINAESQPQTSSTNSTPQLSPELELPKSTIWQSGVGEGFLPTAQNFGVEVGIAPGMAAFGSSQAHDLALISLVYGHMLGHVKGEGHWYRGNFEGRLELFGGGQYSPSSEWVIGLTPHLRYNFATGTRWIPFLDGGAGVTATGIGHPDLGGTFEFNLQATAGVHWFVRDNLALTGDVRYMHMSCAGIDDPNHGVNNIAFMIGVTWFFGK